MKAYKVSRAALVSFCVASIFAGAVMADPHRLDEVVITAPKSVGELINGNDVPPPPPPITEQPVMVEVKTTVEKIEDLIKKVKKACRASNESCDDWAARMVAPVVFDSNGVPTGAGMGFCAGSMTAINTCKLGVIQLTLDATFCAAIKCPGA
jgi:hypothetical protein